MDHEHPFIKHNESFVLLGLKKKKKRFMRLSADLMDRVVNYNSDVHCSLVFAVPTGRMGAGAFYWHKGPSIHLVVMERHGG